MDKGSGIWAKGLGCRNKGLGNKDLEFVKRN